MLIVMLPLWVIQSKVTKNAELKDLKKINFFPDAINIGNMSK